MMNMQKHDEHDGAHASHEATTHEVKDTLKHEVAHAVDTTCSLALDSTAVAVAPVVVIIKVMFSCK